MGLKWWFLALFVPVLSTQALLGAHTGGLAHTIGGNGPKGTGKGGEARRCAVCQGSSLCVLDE
ncbi:hypothetical protein MGG_15843 [Pyricularia oryzae 70-15]|uniref:Uncharacterized protein n=2 Tax=Pyricularia oryzae TaxID=318829 RepID=G4MZQ3_PYRO7|nr:uncharacterized protein MGG_15843 [Pyricularia oryzae 70-15]EHA55417.1 hypothetical protein MGG_15843 [Pyricularia oryzae 70-15]KAI7919273.1 hypothetical protein M0657_007183 [Pyricularia oryzae]KAI7925472.1 hypothetical protein M9X92_003246 [Pyricularia oryzae]QBZ57118.1 hypothetical protein PoMZ_02040 [Pyricularia oryzae]